jgi:hypothetical protein
VGPKRAYTATKVASVEGPLQGKITYGKSQKSHTHNLLNNTHFLSSEIMCYE